MCYRKLSVFFLVLLVASFSLWALPGARKSEEKAAQEAVPQVTAGQAQVALTSKDSTTPSEEELNRISQSLNGLYELLNSSKFVMGADKIEKLGSNVDNLRDDIAIQNALFEAQTAEIERLKKEAMKTRFFADFGVSAGVKEDTVKLGLLGEMGVKVGKGLLIKTGVTWSAFDAKDLIKVPELKIEDLTMSCAIGWQW